MNNNKQKNEGGIINKRKKLFVFLFAILFLTISAPVYLSNNYIKTSIVLKSIFRSGAKEIIKQKGYSVAVWSKVNNRLPDKSSKTVEFDDKVSLIAVITYKGQKYSNSELLIKKGITKRLKNLPGKIKFNWFKLEAENLQYSSRNGWDALHKGKKHEFLTNMVFNLFKLDEITYIQTPFGNNAGITDIDQKSDTNVPIKWENKYVGTMRYKVEIEIEDNIRISSFGRDKLNKNNFSEKNK